MVSAHRTLLALGLALSSLSTPVTAHPHARPARAAATPSQLGPHAQDMLDTTMAFLDRLYDPAAGYLSYFYYPQAAGCHETRSSVWYAAGLLQRNRGADGEVAERILRGVIGGQFTNVSAQWYGDYTIYPEQPTVGGAAYAPVIYNSWDPNWRGFIATALIVIYEEHHHLLSADLQTLVLDSLRHAARGDGYRVGGVDGDNLYPAYSNAWLMRALATGWTGRRLGDENLTRAGEAYAAQFLDLFDRDGGDEGTLSEFNSPTYVGVSLYALTLWAKYMPAAGDDTGSSGNGSAAPLGGSSLMGRHGPRVFARVWEYTASLYHARLRNLAGPWDRAYGYDMNRYVSLAALHIWALAGRAQAFGGTTEPVWSLAHADDAEMAPLLAILAPFAQSLLPAATLSQLTAFPGPHTVALRAYAPPYDRPGAPRNCTTWLGEDLTIGAEAFDEGAVVGGPSLNAAMWNPAVVQWARPDAAGSDGLSVGYFTLYPTEPALDVAVAAGWLNVSYPRGNASSVFTWLVAPNPLLRGKRDVAGWADVEGLEVAVVRGTLRPEPTVSFCGLVGGACAVNQ